MTSKKILYLAHRIPYPPNKGDKIRTFNEIRHLARNHELYLAFLVDDLADVKYIEALREFSVELTWDKIEPRRKKVQVAPQMLIGKPLSVPYFYSCRLQRAIDVWAAKIQFDAVLCFSGPMAEYVFRSRVLRSPVTGHPSGIEQPGNGRRAARRPLFLMDFCDVDSDKWGQYAVDAKFPMNIVYGLEQKRLLAFEARVNRVFHQSIFVTENEAQLFKNMVPDARNLQVVGNGVDFEYFDPGFCRGEAMPRPKSNPQVAPTDDFGNDLVFTGAMDYHANVDAVVWFCQDILPLIREAGIGSDFCIVGGKPTHDVQNLGRLPGVKVTGFVDDIRPWYARAAVSVIPLRLARGVQNKVLEAMAMGRPVVTTRKAADGVGAKDMEHLIVADGHKAFAGAVIDLYKDAAARQQLGEAARRFVVENFDWQRNMEKLEHLL